MVICLREKKVCQELESSMKRLLGGLFLAVLMGCGSGSSDSGQSPDCSARSVIYESDLYHYGYEWVPEYVRPATDEDFQRYCEVASL